MPRSPLIAPLFLSLSLAALGGCPGPVGPDEPPPVDMGPKEEMTVPLTVSRSGDGTILSAPGDIACGDRCSTLLKPGTQVNLTAAPAPGNRFDGWSGACTGSQQACSVTVEEATVVIATFSRIPDPRRQTYPLSVVRTGEGTVTSAPGGISCGAQCNQEFPEGTQVNLTAQPAAGYLFNGWSGACGGSGSICTVMMDRARSATATFVRQCQWREFTVNPGNRTLVPPHVRGDADFDGNGPDVWARASLDISGGMLRTKIEMTAQETDGGDTRAEGWTTFDVWPLPAGYDNWQFLGNTWETTGYVDSNHDDDTWTGLSVVNRWLFTGDTKGDEAGTRTKVTVEYKPVRLKARESNGCQP